MVPFDFQPRTRVVFGPGRQAPRRARRASSAFGGALLVADPGIRRRRTRRCRRSASSRTASIDTWSSMRSARTRTARWSKPARAFAAPLRVDSIVGLGGGSSLDCAKGINFLLTNGGAIADYRGYGKAPRPLLPMIGVPTTAGHRQRGAELRRHRGRRHAHEDGLRRSVGGGQDRDPRSRPHAARRPRT